MRTLSIFSHVPGALALGASICSLTLAALAGTASATVVSITVPYSAPQGGLQTVPPSSLASCYAQFDAPGSSVNDVIDCALTDPSNAAVPPRWKTGVAGQPDQTGDMVLLESGVLSPPSDCMPVPPIPNGLAAGCSDIVRFVNLPTGPAGALQAHIFVASDSVAVADQFAIPAQQGGTMQFATENASDAGQIMTKRQVTPAGAGPVRVLLKSDIPATFSDSILVWY